ncbi:MAG: tetratricopeptide repeat protein, partial [Ignavibacteriales bacterium]|nr:tetratricopeptide repeat protein [Ignavibacteriales bacterium]
MIRKIFFLLSGLFAGIAGCDFSDRPLTDATDSFERAVGLYEEKSFRQAETLFVQSLPVFEQRGQNHTVAEVHRYLGQIHLAEGRLYTALGKFEISLSKTKKENDFRSEITINNLIGDSYYAMGVYHDALSYYGAARQLSSAFNDVQTKAEIEMKIGATAFVADRFEESLRSYLSALSYYQSNGNNASAAFALGRIGEIYARQNRYPEALNSLTQARTLIEKSNEPVLDARLRMNLGLVYKAQANLNEALRLFREAANTLRSKKIGREYETLLLFHIGNVYFDNGRYTDAKKYYADASGIARASGDRIAEGYAELCSIRCDEYMMPSTGKMQATEKIIQSFLQLARQFKECGHHAGESYAYAQAGRLYESIGNLSKSQDMLRQAVSLQEGTLGEFTQPEFHRPYQEYLKMRGKDDVYAQLASVLMQTKNHEEALRILERASSKTYYEVLQDAEVAVRVSTVSGDVNNCRTKLRELRMLHIELSSLLSKRGNAADEQWLNNLRLQIERLEQETKDLSARIMKVHPNYEPLVRSGSLKLQEIQNAIPRGTLAVRFLLAGSELHVFAISKTRFEVRSIIVTKEKLFSLVEEYKRLLNDPSVYTGTGGEASVPVMTRFATLSTQLYDYLLRPVDPLFERNLVIITSPEFENFPFHTIERQDRNGTVKYLVEITSVDYLPSLSSFKFKTASSSRINDIVAMGNPTGKNWSIDYELRDIRSFFKEAKVLISREASWEKLRAAKADVLHLSTEFLMDEGRSVLGAIALSNGQTGGETVKVSFEKLSELLAAP